MFPRVVIVMSLTKKESMLLEITEAISKPAGDSFFSDLSLACSKAIEADIFVIGRLLPSGDEKVLSLAFIVDGEEQEPIIYDLKGTPCELAVKESCCLISENAAVKYPTDKFLEEYGLTAYVGASLDDDDGNRIGVVAALFRSPIADDSLLVPILNSIARRVQLEMARADSDAQLAEFVEEVDRARHEIEKQANELMVARDRAQASTKAKGEFLANMSHEIRTPMNGVLGMCDLLLETELKEDQLEYAEIIKTSADSLLAVINDILDFSKIEAGKLEIQNTTFALNDILEKVEQILKSKVEHQGVELSVVNDFPHASITADPDRLSQILLNLLSNAVKFTPTGGVIRTVIDSITKDGQLYIQFQVEDSGIGIPVERQEKIFEAFTQADSSTTRRFGGTGLGLSICSQLCRLMGGDISLDSSTESGSVFLLSPASF